MRIRIVSPPGPYSGGEGLVVGDEYDMTDDQAARWLRRGVAVAVDELTNNQAEDIASSGRSDAKIVRRRGPDRASSHGVLTIVGEPVADVKPLAEEE